MLTNMSPHLSFNGNCAEALDYYVKALGAEITFLMTMGESPMAAETPVEMHGAIMHAAIKLPNGALILGADAPPHMYEAARGTVVSLSYNDVDEGAKVFQSLVDGGHETMAFGETFWSKGFGMCVDRFGQRWMINCEEPA